MRRLEGRLVVRDRGRTESEECFTFLRTLLDNGAHVQDTKEALSSLSSTSILVQSSAKRNSRRGSKPEQGCIRSCREGKVVLVGVPTIVLTGQKVAKPSAAHRSGVYVLFIYWSSVYASSRRQAAARPSYPV